MKISYCLIIVLICWSSCKNYSGEKTPEKDIVTEEEDQEELGELLSSDTIANQDSTVLVVNVKAETSELASYEINKRECEKCDEQKVLAVSQNMDGLNYQLIYDFLCTFDESCSRNVEYSEFSNEVLYKVLAKHPKAIVELISDGSKLNSEYIYKQISSPLLDYDYVSIINSIKGTEGNEDIKIRIINSVKKAIEG
jgi:hypothetical protein